MSTSEYDSDLYHNLEYCTLCDGCMSCVEAGKQETKAYYPCGHVFGQDCLFRARKGLGGRIRINRYRKAIRCRSVAHCPRDACNWLVHDYCKHLAIPMADPPQNPLTDRGALWIPGPCESCARKKAQRIHKSLEKWRARHDGPSLVCKARPGKIYRRLRKLEKLWAKFLKKRERELYAKARHPHKHVGISKVRLRRAARLRIRRRGGLDRIVARFSGKNRQVQKAAKPLKVSRKPKVRVGRLVLSSIRRKKQPSKSPGAPAGRRRTQPSEVPVVEQKRQSSEVPSREQKRTTI